jgi:hypothetical protein
VGTSRNNQKDEYMHGLRVRQAGRLFGREGDSDSGEEGDRASPLFAHTQQDNSSAVEERADMRSKREPTAVVSGTSDARAPPWRT